MQFQFNAAVNSPRQQIIKLDRRLFIRDYLTKVSRILCRTLCAFAPFATGYSTPIIHETMFAKRFSNILTRALHCREDISPGIRRFIVTTMFAERLYNAYIKSFYGGKLKRLNQDLGVGLDQWKSFALLLNYFILASPYFFVLFLRRKTIYIITKRFEMKGKI